MKKLFTFLLIVMFVFSAALTFAQVSTKENDDKKKNEKKIEKKKDANQTPVIQNSFVSPVFQDPQGMSSMAIVTLGTQVVTSTTTGIGPTNYYWESRRIQ